MQIENSVHFQYLAEELGKSGFQLVKVGFDPDRLVFHKAKNYNEYSVVLNKRTMCVEIYFAGQQVSTAAIGELQPSVLVGESGAA